MKKTILLAGMCALLLCSCAKKDGQKAEKNLKVTILTSQGSFRPVMNEMAQKVKEDTGYILDFQVVPDDQYYALAKARIATNEVPDIIEYNTPINNIELQATQNCLPLDNEPWAKRLVNPNLLKDLDDGKMYAMPRDSGTFFGGAYFNKKVLADLGVSAEQPATYAEFIDRLEQIKTKSGGKITPIYASNRDSWTTQIFMTLGFSVAMYPNDGEIYQKLLKNEVKFTDVPEMKEVLGMFKDLYKKGYINKDHLSASYDMAKEAIGTGKAAMLLQGEWCVSDINSKWPDVEFGSWVVPYKDKLIMGTGAYVRGWFVMKNGKNVEAAREVLDIWSQPKYQNMYYSALPGFSAFSDVGGGEVNPAVTHMVDTYIKGNKYCYQINDQMAILSPVWPELWKQYIDMVATDKTPEQILATWQKKYEDYMKQMQQPGF